ncbi:MAG: hypothetical protein HZB42_07235 [Sphingobacteriales bacterium]|nr:hypothetical protein [Sphingobacteriales bacterium]
MKQTGTILFLFFVLTSFSQQAKIDFRGIDQKVSRIESADPVELSQKLTSGYSSDIEKVRAIFRWITENISYKAGEARKHSRTNSPAYEEDTDTAAIKPLDERVAAIVLKNGTAVCDGYARLFKTLSDFAGIKCEVITGFARSNRRIRRFGSNHTWNAVMINSKWELMDPTWASGYMAWQGDHFVKEFDELYFMTPPEKFIEEHYPDNLHWTLMDDPPLMPEFRNSPYKQKTFSKYRIKSYNPQKGLIEAAEGDTLYFELESSDAARDHQIYSDLFPDTSVYKTPNSILLSPSSVDGNKTGYSYIVGSADIKWLYILYNDDVILRYRLQIKKDKTDIATAE